MFDIHELLNGSFHFFIAVVSLANKFTPLVNQEDLKEEFEESQLLEDEEIPLLGGEGKPIRVDQVWASILHMRSPMGEERFPTLKKTMKAVLSLPHSNADCERAFSVVRKIHTDCRKNMTTDTLTALLQCKMNTDTCCDLKPSDKQLHLAKKAVSEYNQEHSSID